MYIFEIYLVMCSVDLPEVCEEAQLDASEMHIPMVSPTGVHCK